MPGRGDAMTHVMLVWPEPTGSAGPAALYSIRGSSITDTEEILAAVPTGVPLSTKDAAAAIDACLRCVQACTTCASADPRRKDLDELRACTARCITCADVCDVTARVLSRPAQWDQLTVHRLLQTCIRASRTAPRSAPGTLTITVTAQSAKRSAGPAPKHASRCSRPTTWTTPKTGPAPDSHRLVLISAHDFPSERQKIIARRSSDRRTVGIDRCARVHRRLRRPGGRAGQLAPVVGFGRGVERAWPQ